MIIWLASFPRSGNTFLRVLLKRCFDIDSYSIYEDKLLAEVVGYRPNSMSLREMIIANEIFFVKKHDLPSDDFPAIYLVRDGRDALVSYAHYVLTYEQKGEVEITRDVFNQTLHDLIAYNTSFGGWQPNVLAWIGRSAPTAIVKFESLVTSGDPLSIVRKALNDIGYSDNLPAIIDKAPSFGDLHDQMPKFFREGRIAGWKNEFPADLLELFWDTHGKAMELMEYPIDGQRSFYRHHDRQRLDIHNLQEAMPKNHLLISNPEQLSLFSESPMARNLYITMEKMRLAALEHARPWAGYSTLQEYAQVCFWTIRKIEYSFIARQFVTIADEAKRPLKVLDVGCGVVPLNNWIAKQGHEVVALDPRYEDISFLVTNNLNQFYETNVAYLSAFGERLPFPDQYFDVVTSVSVLEHTIPGNDRVILDEIARVLKPTGHLLITFDVSPPQPFQEGETILSEEFRTYPYPFHPAAVRRLYHWLSRYFNVEIGDVPPPLDDLTWDQVHAFWQATQQKDGRESSTREYLALGVVLPRNGRTFQNNANETLRAYQEGQAALEQQLSLYSHHAGRRLEVIQNLQASLLEKKQQLVEKDEVINLKEELLVEKNKVVNLEEELLAVKERVIQNLREELLEKERAIQSLREELPGKDQAIQSLREELSEKDQAIQSLQEGLFEKEKIIQEFRTSYFYWIVNGPFRWFPNLRSITSRVRDFRRRFQPNVGVLQQYSPQPLIIPSSYGKPPHGIHDRPLPSISIVTPSFNQGEFIERTLRSVLDQEYPHLEYIIQDGNSKDGTLDVLKSFQQKLTYFESRPDNGQAHAINLGFQHTGGEIMAYLNSDDLLLPGSLRYVADYFTRHPQVDVVYSHRVIIDEKDREIGRWVLPPHDNEVILWADYVPQESLFWRRTLWKKTGGQMDESFKFAMDWDLLLKFRAAGAKIVRLPRFLAAFRVHTGSKTSVLMSQTGLMEMNRLRQQLHDREVRWEDINIHIRPYLIRSIFYHKLYRLGLLRY